MRRRVFFRTDGNSDIGLGHIYRTISLASFIKNDFDCFFLLSNISKGYEQIVSNLYKTYLIEAINIDSELEQMDLYISDSDLLVLDGYDFSNEYISAVKKKVKRLIQIDDYLNKHPCIDLFINHGAQNKDFGLLADRGDMLLGFEHVILRSEFVSIKSQKKKVYKIDTVFICMGGADPFGITIKALQAAASCEFLKKIIIYRKFRISYKQMTIKFLNHASFLIKKKN